MSKINREGLSLIEIIITMAVFLLTMAAASSIFSVLLAQFKQQSSIVEANVEGIIGLEIMRNDIVHAGYGLPWNTGGAVYDEADNSSLIPAVTDQDEESYNDAPSGTPRCIVSGNGDGRAGSDVLVVKSAIAAMNGTCEKWTHLFRGNRVREWEPASYNLETSDRVVVISLAGGGRSLVTPGGSFSTRYQRNGAADDSLDDPSFAPHDDSEVRAVYGIAPPASPVATPLRMPFNRADYYIRTPASNLPVRCANGTGVLYKGVLNQGTGATAGGGISEYPIIDCAADMQATFHLDTDADGSAETISNDVSMMDARDLREQLREVHVFILAQEGQRDPSFTFSSFSGAATCPTCVRVGESAALGRDFDLSAITDFRHYRWKVYALTVQPNNLK